MKPTTTSRWLKLLAWLLVLVIIVMLIIPSDLTNEQLAQIQPGMTIAEVTRLLGNPVPNQGSFAITGGSCWWILERNWGMPTLRARIPEHTELIDLAFHSSSTWIGKTHVFWVEVKNGIVTRTWMLPITRTGGGLQGCIDSLKQYWNNWRK